MPTQFRSRARLGGGESRGYNANMKAKLLIQLMAAGMACAAEVRTDICVYGGTSAGIAAALQAVRMGKTVSLVEPSGHVGGLTTGGLGATDIGNKAAIGGIAREFYERVFRYYENKEVWKLEDRDAYLKKHRGGRDPVSEVTGRETLWFFEPSAAASIYRDMLLESGVQVQVGEPLTAVAREGRSIASLTTGSGNVWRAAIFLDCTYEGDLMAKAGVSYHVGREANAVYGEKLNGVRGETPKHQFSLPVDPWKKPGDPTSGLLRHVQTDPPGEAGSGDHTVQAYNFRLCMTQDPANRRAWEKPEGYDEADFELLARYLEARAAAGKPLTAGQLFHPLPMPNRKTDTNNNGGFSTDVIGMNYAWPEASHEERAKIFRDHERYTRGFFYFLSSSARVPGKLREEVASWGLTKDEWPATGGWPPQLYVREARRMMSSYVMTEDDCRGVRRAEDPVGIGAYNMDSHNCRRIVRNGRVENEGDVQEAVKPYPVSWRSIIPKASECTNLAVPVCLSASHIAYGSIRMEPVFMILAQSAATGACLALETGVTLAELPYGTLRERLLADGQILEFGTMPRRKP
jgi:hypothetical protein